LDNTSTTLSPFTVHLNSILLAGWPDGSLKKGNGSGWWFGGEDGATAHIDIAQVAGAGCWDSILKETTA